MPIAWSRRSRACSTIPPVSLAWRRPRAPRAVPTPPPPSRASFASSAAADEKPTGRWRLNGTRFHIVGIGGMGMSAVARLLMARGDTVSGSDSGAWPLAQALAADGATVATKFDPKNVLGADILVRSSAYGDANPEVAAARAAGVPVW